MEKNMNNNQEKLLFDEVCKKNPNLETIKNIIDSGTNINIRDKDGETILFNAIEYINDIKWKDENGDYIETSDEANILLQTTVPKIDISIIEFLLKLGADPNIENYDGYRCLLDVVYTFRSDIFSLFLEYGADINFKADGEEYFCDWIVDELNEFKNEDNKIAVEEIEKMVKMINEYKNKINGT
jgi:ankyrin repeat protein